MIGKLHSMSKSAADLIRKHDYARIISHNDADGLTSAGIVCHALNRAGIGFHVTISSRLDEDTVSGIGDELVIFCDMGSGRPELISSLGVDAVVIDHHVPVSEEIGGAVHVNCHLVGVEGSTDVSAAGISYSVAVQMNKNNVDLAGLALTGAMGDRQLTRGVNLSILDEGIKCGAISTRKGLNIGDGDIVELLTYGTDPFLEFTGDEEGVKTFLDKLGISGNTQDMDDAAIRRLASAIILKIIRSAPDDVIENLIGDVYTLKHEVVSNPVNFVNLLDAVGKLDRAGLGVSLCLRDESGLQEAADIYHVYQNKVISGLRYAIDNSEEANSVRYVFANDKDVTAALASTLVRYVFTDRPLMIFNSIGEYWKLSSRGTRKHVSGGLDLAYAMSEGAKSVGGVGGGHNIASGARIPKGSEDEFIRAVDNIVSKQLSTS